MAYGIAAGRLAIRRLERVSVLLVSRRARGLQLLALDRGVVGVLVGLVGLLAELFDGLEGLPRRAHSFSRRHD